jgi:hypothetical protein
MMKYKFIDHRTRIPFLILLQTLLVSVLLHAQQDTLVVRSELGGDGYRDGQFSGLGRVIEWVKIDVKK